MPALSFQPVAFPCQACPDHDCLSPFPVRFPPATDPAQELRQAPVSPCLRLCRIGEDGLCAGCLRSLDEIARWSRMDEAERRRMIDDVLAGRERERYGFL